MVCISGTYSLNNKLDGQTDASDRMFSCGRIDISPAVRATHLCAVAVATGMCAGVTERRVGPESEGKSESRQPVWRAAVYLRVEPFVEKWRINGEAQRPGCFRRVVD
ncbi:hypothetical protein SKAU_G00304370 [Synaphobranchus kaupii]|uniref:Uncharacterized protein n=1 Tax=Synaphobranchus kaupii TaxID=118154 RepID=A0A9Q1INB7_SYNKA|nr:hypothetical protein SKAU_G00304370 [Synaphobranchus kaupii]